MSSLHIANVLVVVAVTPTEIYNKPTKGSKVDKFSIWCNNIDSALMGTIGLAASDLPDIPFRAYFDDGLTPAEAIESAVEDGWWSDLEGFF